jgi:hypothetical protein
MTSKLTEVMDDLFGVYVWEMPNGRLLANENLDVLSIESEYGDIRRMRALRDVVRSFGINEGKPRFMSGSRKITQEQYDWQKERLLEGKDFEI